MGKSKGKKKSSKGRTGAGRQREADLGIFGQQAPLEAENQAPAAFVPPLIRHRGQAIFKVTGESYSDNGDDSDCDNGEPCPTCRKVNCKYKAASEEHHRILEQVLQIGRRGTQTESGSGPSRAGGGPLVVAVEPEVAEELLASRSITLTLPSAAEIQSSAGPPPVKIEYDGGTVDGTEGYIHSNSDSNINGNQKGGSSAQHSFGDGVGPSRQGSTPPPPTPLHLVRQLSPTPAAPAAAKQKQKQRQALHERLLPSLHRDPVSAQDIFDRAVYNFTDHFQLDDDTWTADLFTALVDHCVRLDSATPPSHPSPSPSSSDDENENDERDPSTDQ
ncbi:hypothetical protein UCRPA7_7410 [Phaeoacremonium minimum UCRPA7]|uniref:Uncharacterized protein n=1 Tax=Phaeoacremonium minimum (strain UCR-PA7) TaxID=1286976 RepID=R8BCR2_PHAM7|nr:hypothetical protein UCRPA7_7410 [Phaeoacremonium minimum UCRPA7]EON97077.1 hypothetical protein UCRPA7_7410 [Phaeoacremonium minimum UCRPA7]